ncbi:hypothetical protein QBC37DRAFT_151450 [Rhypophila decipiens]|uniref:Uncharacterized protein n=1 Tax=Rhypophila decipiens TaxID=261697 RepID=A0AAN7BFA8_9PEZI|nr:hypothetical protein QBC37DRAFT_151450 [Rhypophila decipiens]
MAAAASHLLLSKSNHQSKPTSLTVKTIFSEAGKHGNGRAKAIRAADWRNPATTASLSNLSRIKHRSSEEEDEQRTSSENSSISIIEMDELNGESVTYLRPNSEQAPWEMISSAPAASSLTQSELLDLCLADITNVEFKDVKPVVMNVNGEQIVLPTKFTFDITPVYLSDKSSEDSARRTLGQLKRVRDPSQIRTKSPQRSNLLDELPDDLKDLLSHDAKGTSGQEQPRKKASGTTPDKPLIQITEYPPHKCSKLEEADKQRFKHLIDRLNNLNKEEDKPSQSNKPAMSAFDVRSSDPAIIAAKVKEATVTVRSLRNSDLQKEASEPSRSLRAPMLLKPEYSHDSGYGTGFNLQRADSHHASTQTSAHTGVPGQKEDTKKLNPAAAEFRFSGETAHMPFLVPKRLSRPPLTDSLFEAPAGAIPSQSVSTPVRRPSGSGAVSSGTVAPQTQVTRQTGLASHGNDQPAPVAAPELPHPPPLGNFDPRTSQVSLLSGLLPGSLPGVYPPVDLFSRTLNMNSAVPYSTMLPTISGPMHSFGTVSSNGLNSFPLLGTQMGLPSMNSFGTLPPPNMALPVAPLPPSFNQNQTLPGPSNLAALPGPGEPLAAVFGTDRNVVGPPFPVTQKPRDHDPVKQQQYEAYLEWRKANEPGYHIQCKIRQANRVVRQHKMKQAGLTAKGTTNAGEKTENPAWKEIVEKAKAVVANAAAAAAAEKRSRGDSVREEFRAKIQESCSDLLKTKPQVPAKQQAESSNTEEKKADGEDLVSTQAS